MNLITSEGLAMIDTDNVVHLRRVHYACPVERSDRREPMTPGLRMLRSAAFIASALFVIAFLGCSYEVLSSYDWTAVAQLLGSKR